MKTQIQERRSSYGEHGLTFVDNFGVYLSKRKILKSVHGKRDLTALDIGCGFDAQILVSLLPHIKEGTGIDIKVSERAKSINKFSFIEGDIEQALQNLPDEKFDLILMISVLEHLWHPQDVLIQCFRALKPGSIFLINVPTWRGKFFLEFSAFKLGTSPSCEIDDHKMYYAKQTLWPLLVQAGFKPRQIHLNYIKFGINLFARIYKS